MKLKKRNFGNLMCPVFEFLKFRIPVSFIIRNDKILKSWKVEDEEWPDITFPSIKSTTAWIWISFRSKNMERKYSTSNQLLYFQVRESLSPINIPIPTPASDWDNTGRQKFDRHPTMFPQRKPCSQHLELAISFANIITLQLVIPTCRHGSSRV